MKNIICSIVFFSLLMGLVNASSSPCNTFENIENRDAIETAYVLYRDAFKVGNYEEAFPLWEKAFGAAPAANGKVSYQYDDGIYMYHLKYSKAAESEKQAIFEKIMELYDSKSACYGNTQINDSRKAFDSYYYFSEYADRNEIFHHFKNCIDSEKLKTPAYVINPFTELLVEKYFEDQSISMEEAQVLVGAISNIIDHAASTKEKESDWAKVRAYVSVQLELFEQVKGFYPCGYYKSKYLQSMAIDHTNCNQIDAALSLAKWAGCPTSDDLYQAIDSVKNTHCKVEILEEEREVAPSCLKEAYQAYLLENYELAISKYTCAIKEEEDHVKKAAYAMLISKMYFSAKNISYAKARKWAEKAASFKPGWGEPYIVIGKLYASSAKICSNGDSFKSQIVTWPAIDMFIKAKTEDPSVSEQATRLINYYSKYMPSYEELFGREIPLGSSYKVGCWINRNTTVRKAP